MLTARSTRTIAAPLEELWTVVCDPHHLPRWWPRVTRVEGVHDGAFTEVMKTRKGKTVRADFDIVEADEARRVVRWDQRVKGTPFEAVLDSSETELSLAPARSDANAAFGQDAGGAAAPAQATEVTIELRQEMGGRSSARTGGSLVPRFGRIMVRRAAAATIEEALDGLERISA